MVKDKTFGGIFGSKKSRPTKTITYIETGEFNTNENGAACEVLKVSAPNTHCTDGYAVSLTIDNNYFEACDLREMADFFVALAEALEAKNQEKDCEC